MAKWFGVIGFTETVETRRGIWEQKVTEKNFYGDVTRINRKLQSSDKVNDDITISNEISLLMDTYITDHIFDILYVTYLNHKWKVTNVSVDYPRLTLTLGGKYNGDNE